MKAINKVTIGLVAATLLMTGCVGDGAKSSSKTEVKEFQTEASLGLRKTDIYSENTTSAAKTEYGGAMPTTSTRFQRAFQDAPPMIPHDTTGLLPIKIGENQCTGCHMPDVAPVMGATPIPVSHFTDFRPKHILYKGIFIKVADNYKNDVTIRQTDKLQGARYNCSQCHAPQSQGNLAVENTFQPQYNSPTGASRSTWQGGKLTDGLDTVKGGDNFVTKKDIANKNSAAGSLNDAGH